MVLSPFVHAFEQCSVFIDSFLNDILAVGTKVLAFFPIKCVWIDWLAIFNNHMRLPDFWKSLCTFLWQMVLKISAVLFIEIGTSAHPVLSAILSAPSLNRSIFNSSPVFLVPSGKIQMEIPCLI